MTQPLGPTAAIGQQVRTYRQQRGWSARELADRCREAGLSKWNREIVTNLEIGRRSYVSVDELFALAVVFGIPPLALCVPLEAARYAVTPKIAVHPWNAARWYAGLGPGPLGIENPTREQLRAWHTSTQVLHVYQRVDKALADLEPAERNAIAAWAALDKEENRVSPDVLDHANRRKIPEPLCDETFDPWLRLLGYQDKAMKAETLRREARANAEKALNELLDNGLAPPRDLAKYAAHLPSGERLISAFNDLMEGGKSDDERADS